MIEGFHSCLSWQINSLLVGNAESQIGFGNGVEAGEWTKSEMKVGQTARKVIISWTVTIQLDIVVLKYVAIVCDYLIT